MNNSYLQIQPKNIIEIADKISIRVSDIQINKYAIISVEIFNVDSKLINRKEFILDGINYQNWTNDDYLIQYVCNEFGFTLV
jgi:hypothetical protein